MHRLLLLSCLWLVSLNTYALNPSREYRRLPEDLGIPYDSVKIFSPDGYELNTWVMHPRGDAQPTTILVAGSDAGNMADLLPYAHQLLARGYPVVTFDYRGFGDSSNFAIDNDYLYYREFITDFVTVADWIKAECRPARLAVLGFSMGTLVAAAGYARSPFDAFVGDGPVVSPTAVHQRIVATTAPATHLPDHAALDDDCLLEMPVPMLLFAGVADPIVTLGDAQRVARANPLCTVVPHEGRHLQGAAKLGLQTYFDRIDDFLRSS